jgi:hypothetical protein
MRCDASAAAPTWRTLRLALIAVCTVAGAVHAQEPPPRPRLEAAATMASTSILPAVGALVSVRTGRQVAVEAGVELLPWIIPDDNDEAVLLVLAQVRLPWKEGGTRRRSITLGCAGVALLQREWRSGPGEAPRSGRRLELSPRAIPYAGIAWQWHTHRAVQLRLDVQAFAVGIPFPRVAFGVGWGGFRSASAASPRTSGR